MSLSAKPETKSGNPVPRDVTVGKSSSSHLAILTQLWVLVCLWAEGLVVEGFEFDQALNLNIGFSV